MSGFYVYVLIDPRKPGEYVYDGGEYDFQYQPFYVGKGKGKRAWDHVMEAKQANGNRHPIKVQYIRGMINDGVDPIIIKLHTGLTEEEAFTLEAHLISLIGRKDLDKGPLTNMSDGGEGQTGLIHSEETREIIRQKVKAYRAKYPNPFAGKRHSPESRALLTRRRYEQWARGDFANRNFSGENNPNYGNRWSDQQKARMSKVKTGTKMTDEAKRKISVASKKKWQDPEFRKRSLSGREESRKVQAQKVSKKWKITFPDGEIKIILNLNSFCRDHNLPSGAYVGLTSKGKWRGWTIERIETES